MHLGEPRPIHHSLLRDTNYNMVKTPKSGRPKNRRIEKRAQAGVMSTVNKSKGSQQTPKIHEICRITKFGNWEFEGLEAFVKGDIEGRLTGH